MMAEK
jgi:hypothetical protein